MSIEVTLSRVGKILDRICEGTSAVAQALFAKCFGENAQCRHSAVTTPWLVLIFDSFLAFFSIFISIHLRIGMDFLDYSPLYILKNMLVFSLVSASVFLWLQTNQAFWRYTTIEDMLPIFLSVVLSNLLFFPLMTLMNRSDFLPYSVLVINVFVLSFSLMMPRFLCRMIHNQKISKIKRFDVIKQKSGSAADTPQVLIVGNVPSIEAFCREVISNEDVAFNFAPVGILTIEPAEMGRTIAGLPILGELRDIRSIMGELGKEGIAPKQLVLTERQVPDAVRKFITRYAQSHGILLLHVLFQYSLNQMGE